MVSYSSTSIFKPFHRIQGIYLWRKLGLFEETFANVNTSKSSSTLPLIEIQQFMKTTVYRRMSINQALSFVNAGFRLILIPSDLKHIGQIWALQRSEDM